MKTKSNIRRNIRTIVEDSLLAITFLNFVSFGSTMDSLNQGIRVSDIESHYKDNGSVIGALEYIEYPGRLVAYYIAGKR